MKLIIAVAVIVFAASANADPGVPEKAKQLAERGRQLHHDGHYTEAIEAYKAAYVLAPASGLLFNLAQAYRLAGDCDDAAWMYRRYLDSQPSDDARTVALAHLAHLESCSHGGLAITPEPDVPDIHLPATTVTPSPRKQPPSPAPDARSYRSKQIGTWLVVGGGGGLVLASLAALDAHEASNDVSDAYAHHAKVSDIRTIDERGQRSATIARWLGATSGLAVVSGALLYSVGRHYEQANHVAVIPHAAGASVSFVWGF